jgi:NAD(P)H-dependent FMN reductase
LTIAASRAPAGVVFTSFTGLAAIRPFSPEIDPSPAEVEAWRELVRNADAVLFATPEYAHGLPGVLKNALDWLVGSGELYEKRATVLSAAPSAARGQYARADLERTLRAQGVQLIDSATIAVPTSVRGHEVDDPAVVAAVDAALAAIIAAVSPAEPAPAGSAGTSTSSAPTGRAG